MNNITVVNKFKTLHISSFRCLSYKKGMLYIHDSIKEKPTLLCAIPMNKLQRIFSKARFTERMFHIEPRTTIDINENEYLISFCGSIFKLNAKNGEIIKDHNYHSGMSNVMNFCKIEGVKGFDDCIVYGEYWGNGDREAVSVYSRKDDKWEKAYSFKKAEIRHIHAIVADPYRNGVLILTGDEKEESGIWIARDNFKKVEPLILGSQCYRACVAFPVKEGIIYASDAPAEKNFIAIAFYENNEWKTNNIYEMPGPCIYAVKVLDEYVFATTVEPDIRLKGIKYRVTYRLAQGINDRYTHIIIGNDKNGFKDAVKFKKDILPMWLFQFGNVQFPNGYMDGNIIMCPVSVSNYDGKTILYKKY